MARSARGVAIARRNASFWMRAEVRKRPRKTLETRGGSVRALEGPGELPTQADAIVQGVAATLEPSVASTDVDYLQVRGRSSASRTRFSAPSDLWAAFGASRS